MCGIYTISWGSAISDKYGSDVFWRQWNSSTCDSIYFNSFALWEKQLEKDEKRLRTEINRIHHPMPEKLDFSLIIEKNNFVAYEEYAQIKVKMFVVPLLLQSAK